MQLTRLKVFDSQCRTDLIEEGALETVIFYAHRGSWWNLDGKAVEEAALVSTLNEAQKTNLPLRRPSSKDTYFPITPAKAVVKASFPVALREPSRDQISRVLARSLRDADNAFEVEYNQLTGLLGKKATYSWLEDRLRKTPFASAGPEESSTLPSAEIAACVIAIDIDFFKQVNDHYGHSYGDLVLKAFGMRLQDTANKFCFSQSGRAEAVACHASGEEFFCLAIGSVASQVFLELAESIRSAISENYLPDEKQLPILMEGLAPDSVTIPLLRSRTISCSLGVVIEGVTEEKAKDAHLVSRLLKQADLALYRAKALGRNKVVDFSKILEECGRVIEHRQDVGVVTIDIGKDVGVTKGQEFLILHPDFTGNVPYTIDDGRSKRTLGVYPRIPFGRVSVIDVQAQLAFCRRSDNENAAIPAGALLEAIPLGSISHLFAGLSSPNTFGLADWLRTESESREYFKQLIDDSDEVKVLVLRIQNQAELLEKRGAEFVNRVLAASAEVLRTCFPQTRFAGIIEITEIAIVLANLKDFDSEHVVEELEKCSMSLGRLPIFSIGFFAPITFDKQKKWSPPTFQGSLILARYAATYPKKIDASTVEEFSETTAIRVLDRSRSARASQRGLADFESFKNLGFVTASLLNRAGLLASQKLDYSLAYQYYFEANSLKSERNYRLNMFVMKTAMKQPEEAVALLQLGDEEEVFEKPSLYTGAAVTFTNIQLDKLASDPNLEQLETVEKWINKVIEVASSDTAEHWKSLVKHFQDLLKSPA